MGGVGTSHPKDSPSLREKANIRRRERYFRWLIQRRFKECGVVGPEVGSRMRAVFDQASGFPIKERNEHGGLEGRHTTQECGLQH